MISLSRLTEPVVPADCSYVLVTPDGVVGGAVPGVIARLDEHGLQVAGCRLLNLTVEAMAEVYQETSWSIVNSGYADVTFSWDMHGELYGLAPACLIMLRRPTTGVCEAILRCKGHTLPELAAPDTIRWSGENVIFNLVHCPDDGVAAVRELAILVGPAVSAQLLAVARSADPRLDELLGATAMESCLPAFSGWAAISFAVIANKLRRRVVQQLALGVHKDAAALDRLAWAQRLLADEERALAAAPTSGARLEIARRADPDIHADLRAVAAGSGSNTLVVALDSLSQLYRLNGERDLDSVLALQELGVYLSPLEKVIVESHCYAFRPGSDLVRIYSDTLT